MPLLDTLRTALAGRYRIESGADGRPVVLGQGGMASVYLAHDLRHDRRVALKLLRPELGSILGADRFLQEIQVTARLTHPHILPLYDSGEVTGPEGGSPLLYYVMPLVEGESLRHRLQREGQLPIEEAVQIAREAADALDYAHQHDVVHRDIKPENILLQSRHAVVADFGVARAISAAGGDRLTQTGMAVGTPAYMSPEQASGETRLDGRSDIYALGAVLYEMLAGEPPFTGATAQALIAKRLAERARPVTTLRDTVPPHLERAIARALARTPADRYATAAEFGAALELPGPGAERRRGSRVVVAVSGAVLAAAAAFTLFRVRAAPTSAPSGSIASALARQLVQLTFRAEVEDWPAWAPDGRQLVYATEVQGYKKLFVKSVGTGEERQLTNGQQDDIQPNWSPDGNRIAFVRSNLARGKLEPTDVLGWYQEGGDIWTVDPRTGREQQIIGKAFDPAFSPDGARLAFDAGWAGPRRIWITDSGGRTPQQVSTDSSDAVVHSAPRWSPDGSKIVFRRIQGTKSDVLDVDLVSQSTNWITNDNFQDLNPTWSPSGRFIYFSSSRGGGMNLWRIPVSPTGAPTGAAEQLTTGAGDDLELTIAPDGKQLAFAVLGVNSDVWRLPVDPATGLPTGEPEPTIATTRVESRGAWSPDGKTIAFNSDRLGEMNLWLHSLADGTDRRLTTGPGGDYQPNWSPDGKSIAFFSARAGNNDIWTVRIADGELRQLTQEPSLDIDPFYSPDGKRIAFHSDRDGRLEVWVMNADGSGPRRLTSSGVGGHFMRWSSDGRTVTFRAEPPGAMQIFRISVEDGALERLPDVVSGAHMSFAPDRSRIMDVKSHKALWVYPVSGAAPAQVFEFPDPDVRIDYPVWSPDGRWVLFDRAAPRGGDIWVLEGIE